MSDWLIGDCVFSSLAEGSRLPTKGVVMARFLALRRANRSKETREIFCEILKEIQDLWEKAGIPTKSNCSCVNEMMKMHAEMSSIKKIPAGKRNEYFATTKINKFSSSLKELLDLSPQDVDQLKTSRNPNASIDYQFLLAQREIPQRGYIDRLDKKHFDREAKKQKRSASLSRLSATHLPIAQQEQDDSSESELHVSSDDDYSLSSRATPRPCSITLQLPAKTILKATAQAADARDLSVRDHIAMLASTINAGGGDINDVTLSVASGSRQRRQNRRELINNMREQFIKPHHVVIHWDTKLIK